MGQDVVWEAWTEWLDCPPVASSARVFGWDKMECRDLRVGSKFQTAGGRISGQKQLQWRLFIA
jgi:hypothetical protein